MKFQFKYRVAWVDTDALGIMHFSNYFRLCERTEQELMNSLGLEDDETFLPRVDAHCTYKSPLKFNDPVTVYMWVKEIGKSHITFSYEIVNDLHGKVAAQCQIVVVPVDANMKKSTLKEEITEKLRKFMDE